MPALERSARRLRTSNVEHVSTFTDLAAQVRESNINRRARWFYLGLGTLLVAGLVGAAIGTYLLRDSWLVLIMAGALGVLFTQAAFVAHEASHRQILSSGPANDRLGRVIGVLFVGMSYQWWKNKHTRHHANPNKIGKDPDIDLDGVAFTTESAAAQTGLRAFLTRYQGAAFYPLMLLEGVNLHWLSIRSLAERRKVNGRAIEITLLVV